MAKEANNNKPNVVPIPQKGSLGLLAYGYQGLVAWRKKQLNMEDGSNSLVGPVIFGKEVSLYAKVKDEKK